MIFGSGVKSIGGDAIGSCPNVTDVFCYAEEVPRTDKNAFQGSYIEYATIAFLDAKIQK